MRTKSLRLMLAVAFTVGMASCVHFWRSGPPCVGNGCPSGTGGQLPAVAQQAQAQPPAKVNQQAAQNDSATPAQTADAAQSGQTGTGDNAQANAAQANTPAANQQKPGKFTRMLQALHLRSKDQQ